MSKKSSTIRSSIALGVLLIIGVGLMLNTGIGTLSAVGWFDISLLCPLGALGTMLASKLLIPEAVISLGIAVALIILFGRAFCGWICPVPLVQKIRGILNKSPKKQTGKTKDVSKELPVSDAASQSSAESSSLQAADPSSAESSSLQAADPSSQQVATSAHHSEQCEESLDLKTALDISPALKATGGTASASLSKKEKASLSSCSSDCNSCASKRQKLDSRHFILGGSLLSAAVFGFPVFCLVCPIGLSFATILLVIRLFSGGDVTLSLIVVPLLLAIEVLIFRKWCHKLCPLSAFMSLFGKLNRTFQPSIDDSKCIETAQGKQCGLCAKVCEEGIDPRHPKRGMHAMNECTRCRACVDVCPGKAIRMPLLPQKNTGQHVEKASR